MGLAAKALSITSRERSELEALARAHSTPRQWALRARIVLLASDGVSNSEIARRLEVSRPTVLEWRKRFEAERLDGLTWVRPGRGRKPSITAEKVRQIVDATLHSKPANATHWSCRSMARAQGISSAAVQRIWNAHGLQPHRLKTFKASRDPQFVDKLTDVVGLYINPPDKALLLCVDEKSQIQALQRTQPGLPLKKGRCGTMTHDYKRHGTTTLFAARSTRDGSVVSRCAQRHRHVEWLDFLGQIDCETSITSICIWSVITTRRTSISRSASGWQGICAAMSISRRRPLPRSTWSCASSAVSRRIDWGAVSSAAGLN